MTENEDQLLEQELLVGQCDKCGWQGELINADDKYDFCPWCFEDWTWFELRAQG